MTKLTDNLYAVEVPDDAINFSIRPYFERPNLFFKIKISWVVERKSLLYGNWSIIGTVTKDSIDFDCEPLVQKGGLRTYKDYTYVEKEMDDVGLFNALLMMKFKTPQESFRSLLTSAGLTDYNKLVIIKSK
jgi:hypothetical protein